jgi:hypothetical protein
VAGLLAGLAMQTKYTGGLAPAAMLLYALLWRRPLLWALAALVAAQVFVTWETLMALLYGDSHFLLALTTAGGTLWEKPALLPFLFSQLGGLIPVALLLGLAGLGVRSRWLIAVAFLFALGAALVAGVECEWYFPRDTKWPWVGAIQTDLISFSLAEVVFDLFAAAGVVIVGLAFHRLWQGDRQREVVFLLLWLGLEVLVYLVLTPFPAVRRVLGVWLVLGLVIGRLAGETLRHRPGVVRVLLTCAIGLAVAVFLIDLDGARTHQQAALQAARRVRELQAEDGTPPGRVWYVGHWGFQFYAERAGLEPVVVATDYEQRQRGIDLPPISRLRRGDWLVVPDARLIQQGVAISGTPVELVETLTLSTNLPLRTMISFYGGRTPVEPQHGNALQVRLAAWLPVPDLIRRFGGRPPEDPSRDNALEVRLYRVKADFTPEYSQPEW